MRVLAVIGVLAILAAIAAAIFFFGGFYNVAANAPDPGAIKWALEEIRDASVGRAIALMHGDPRRTWSLSRLAREVGLSRSSFAERFTMFVGIPPMQYLAKWRMQTAADLLCDNVNIASIADEVG